MKKPFTGEFPITQRFGEKYTDPDGHTGIDFALYLGTPVRAAERGTVKLTASRMDGYGRYLILAHENDLETLYAHLSEISVCVGDMVEPGEMIGRSGNSGHSTGPHLHFEVRRGGKVIDPEPLFEPDPARDDASEGPAWEVRVPLLYVRSGPGIDYGIVDCVAEGSIVHEAEQNETCWLRIGNNRWIAARYKGEAFCEPLQ